MIDPNSKMISEILRDRETTNLNFSKKDNVIADMFWCPSEFLAQKWLFDLSQRFLGLILAYLQRSEN